MVRCLVRREYDPVELVRAHPPRLRHPNKRLVFELASEGAGPATPITLTRWAASELPATVVLAPTAINVMPGYYDYAGNDAAVWHVNFADPQLFVAYGSALLAQDELQAAEHPVLGSLREALLAESQLALTEQDGIATPVLVAGVERRCTLSTAPDLEAGRPYGLYGNRFAGASPDVVRAAVRVHRPPTHTNLIAIAAPGGGRGSYFRGDIEQILVTAYTGFSGAVAESARMWPGAPVEIRTGFWGCGAFGGNRRLMTLLQLLAARLAKIDQLRFYVFDDAGEAEFRAGAACLDDVLAAGTPNERLAALVERIAHRDFEWGVSNGT